MTALVTLPDLGSRAVEILQMRYGFTGQGPMELDQIEQQFGVARERIHQLEQKSFEALQDLTDETR